MLASENAVVYMLGKMTFELKLLKFALQPRIICQNEY